MPSDLVLSVQQEEPLQICIEPCCICGGGELTLVNVSSLVFLDSDELLNPLEFEPEDGKYFVGAGIFTKLPVGIFGKTYADFEDVKFYDIAIENGEIASKTEIQVEHTVDGDEYSGFIVHYAIQEVSEGHIFAYRGRIPLA